jgi:hypothetical protein
MYYTDTYEAHGRSYDYERWEPQYEDLVEEQDAEDPKVVWDMDEFLSLPIPSHMLPDFNCPF